MAVASAGQAAHQVKHSDATKGLARVGLAAHGVIWVLVGVLAIMLASGKSQGETDQTGALQELAQHTGGDVMLFVLAVGLAAYGLWHLVQVFTGPMAGKDEAKARVGSGFRAVIYGGASVSAFQVAFQGRTKSQANKQQSWTTKVMTHDGGRFLIGVIGAVVIGVGAYLVYKALKTKFEKHLDLSSAGAGTRKTVVFLGKWGGTARGIVIALVGVLFLVAAIEYDPKKARGVDGALKTLRDNSFGPWLLGLVALGLLMFGVYGVSEAKYRRLD